MNNKKSAIKDILLIFSALFVASMLIITFIDAIIDYTNKDKGEWYLACLDIESGQEYLMRVNERPYVDAGVVKIGNSSFITPKPFMSCKIVTAKEFAKAFEEAVVDNNKKKTTI